nr:virulence-associated E family protein [Lachnospiraceae bacterium]
MSKIDYENLSDEQKAQIEAIIESKESPEETERKRIYELLEVDEKGRVKQTNHNCQIVLANDPLFEGAIRFNEFSEKIEICRELGWKRYSKAYCDNDLNHIITYMELRYGLKNDRQIDRAIKIIANDNGYHPIKEKLLSVKWDGKKRLADALHYFLGVKKTELATESLKLFMLGAIERVFNPGCKFELMLCLAGGQGAGKSTFLRFLAMEDTYFTDDIKKLDDDRVFQKLQGHWIVEMPEMLAILNAKRVEETKSFVSRQYDNYRTPYETYAIDHPRQCVFAGTSNNTQFLPVDRSGNRRFLPIEVNMREAECHILENEAASRAYIEQLWAE